MGEGKVADLDDGEKMKLEKKMSEEGGFDECLYSDK